MHNLGNTRSANRRDHLLHTPDTFVRIPLPTIERGAAIVHVSPALGAEFIQYTAEFETTGTLSETADQRFVFVLEGSLEIVSDTVTYAVERGDYAYLPSLAKAAITAQQPTRAAIIEKPYVPHPVLASPSAFFGHEDAAPATALMGDSDLEVRALLPDSPAHDFAVNVMTYQPGAALPMVEVHVMEHGLLMLAGGGIYRLSDQWYPVAAGDFIWMAPWCPQWFGALGKQPAKYLIYKDFHRHPRADAMTRRIE
jgi:(S)-ureidoglycine aminohydrolase